MPRRGHTGHAYRKARADTLTSDVCGICGHHGAREADCIIPVTRGGDSNDRDNLRPSHGTSARCPVCIGANGLPRACNQERGNGPTLTPTTPSRTW